MTLKELEEINARFWGIVKLIEGYCLFTEAACDPPMSGLPDETVPLDSSDIADLEAVRDALERVGPKLKALHLEARARRNEVAARRRRPRPTLRVTQGGRP